MGIITISSLSEVTMASTRFIQWPFVPMTLHCVPVVLCPRPSLVFLPVMIASRLTCPGSRWLPSRGQQNAIDTDYHCGRHPTVQQ